MRIQSIAAALMLLPLTASAAADADIRELREQLRQLKESYEQRIEALERRLAQTEASAGKAEAAANQSQTAAQTAAQQAARPPAGAASPASESAFNPAVSLILSGSATRLSRDPATFRITGFMPSLGDVAPPPRSFSLGESELAVAANIDPHFRGQLTASIPPEGGGMQVEEAYIQTLDLSPGFTLKAGRFLSGLGYLNEQHAHAWDFADAPLAYKAFFGGPLKNDGLQVKWLAPTEVFLELGAEAARGGAFPSTDRNKNGSTLGAVFVHAGGDAGDSGSWRAGLSYVATSPRTRAFEDTDSLGATATDSFSGKSRTAAADFIWKWAPNGNASSTSLKVQSEVFRRREAGMLASNSAAGACGADCAADYASTQSGGYLQGVYQFLPRWRVGLRYDRLDHGTMDIGLVDKGTLSAADFPLLAAYNPKRSTLMFDYNPSEFSRLRLQFARDESRPGQTDHQVWLQYVMSLGAHGAHKF